MQKIVSWAIVLIAFITVFIIEWYTPLHSDDYVYAMLGTSLDTHLNHYLTWSGRVVADYSSALLLATGSRAIISAMTGLLVVVFCYFIVKTPTGTLRWQKHDASIFALVFLTFWIANPNIGQTVFWIVGSANYLWTNLFVVAWIWNMYRIQTQREERTQVLMLILGMLAGCSNESIAPFVVGIAALAVVYDLWRDKRLLLNKCLYFVSALIGTSILIFSPGNFIRAHGDAWYQMSIFQRIYVHVTERVFGHLALIWIAYVVLALLALILLYAQKKGLRFNKFNLNTIILSIVIGIGTSLIMVAAPTYPDRVMMSTFVFFLLAVSFLGRELLNTANKTVKAGVMAINVLLFGVFIWSFSLIYTSYLHVYQQNEVRLAIIENQLAQKKSEFTIPDFHFLKMQNRGGEFDFWHEAHVYGKYFGAQNIYRKTTGFDYSVMVTGEKQHIDANTNAWFNDKGELLVISARPLEGQIHFTLNGKSMSLAPDEFTFVQINDDNWYYKKIPYGALTGISAQ